MYNLNKKKRKWIIKQMQNGIAIDRIASAQKVNHKTVWEIKKKFEKWGDEGLFLSTSGFTKSATEIKRNNVYLGDNEIVIALCETYLGGDHGIMLKSDELSIAKIVGSYQ